MSNLFRSGRGGAGNYHPRESAEAQHKEEDLEGQNLPSSTETIEHSNQPPPEYVHTGRGGAGNLVQPKDMPKQEIPRQESTRDVSQRDAQSSKPLYMGGRGGAGNYEDFSGAERVRTSRDEQRRTEVEKKVVGDVEAGLKRPEPTYGGQGWDELGNVKEK